MRRWNPAKSGERLWTSTVDEPPYDSPLMGCENCILTPHVRGGNQGGIFQDEPDGGRECGMCAGGRRVQI